MQQHHSGLLQGLVGLLPVTRGASRNKVVPRESSSLGLWNDVVQGQFHRRLLHTAILASVVVSGIDVLPREHGNPHRDMPVVSQSDDGRQHQAWVDFPAVVLFNVSSTLH